MDSPSSVFRPKRLILWGVAVIGALALGLASPGPLSTSPIAAQPGALRVMAGGPYSGVVGQPVSFRAEIDLGGVEPGGQLDVTWDFGDGAGGSGESTEHIYTEAGTYNVVVTVVSAGRTASDSTTAEIGPGTRPGQLTVDAGGPYSGSVGVLVSFSADVGLGGRPPGTQVEVRWQFGDGSVGTGANTSHTYTAAGTYTVTVTASVGPDQTATDSTTATISAGPPPTTEPVPLTTGCTNVALTWPVGTPLSTVAAAVTPTTAAMSIFVADPTTGGFRGFSPTAPAFANNFTQVETNLQAVYICTSGPATLNRPTV